VGTSSSDQGIHNMTKPIQFSALTLCAIAVLAGCGGGGGSSETLVTPSEVMQGFWQGTVSGGPGGATQASAVVLPDGTAWIALESATSTTGLAKLSITGVAASSTTASLSGSGQYYAEGGAAKVATTAAGSASTAGTLSGSITIGTAAASTINWSAGTNYKTAALQANVAKNWSSTSGDGAVVTTWAVTSAGVLSGSSTTGCTYTGTLKPNSNPIAVFDLSATETCAGTVQTLTGIGTLNSAKTKLNVAYTAASGNSGGLLAFATAVAPAAPAGAAP
jgi:hypothetical protein